jgi:hypothetical protein
VPPTTSGGDYGAFVPGSHDVSLVHHEDDRG